jgi:hypothetical protein
VPLDHRRYFFHRWLRDYRSNGRNVKYIGFPFASDIRLGAMTFRIMAFSIITFRIMTFSIKTLSIMRFSIMAFSIMTLNIMSFNLTDLNVTLSIKDT